MTWVAAGITVAEAAAAAEAIAIAEAAAAAAAAAETAAATAAAAETASAGITAAEAASTLPEIIAPVTETGAQGILQAAPEASNLAAEGSNAAAQQVQEQAVKQGLEQAVNPDQAMFEEMQKQVAEESFKTAPVNSGTQLAGTTTNAPGFDPGYASDAFPSQYIPNQNLPEPSFFQNINADSIAQNRLEQGTSESAMEAAVNSQAGVEPVNPFMKAYEGASKFVETNPWKTGLGAYGLLSATGALQQKGASPPGQKTFNNPYHFSPNFQGTHPNPNDYQYAPKYPSYAMGGIAGMIDQLTGKSQKTSNAARLSPDFKRGEVDPNDYQYTPRYAMGGIAGIHPQTNFANPAASDMGTSQYSMATDPMSGNIANRMAEGGVTGGGEMQLNVPINIGEGGGGGGFGGGGGYGGYSSGAGYAPPGGPQGGSAGSLASLLKGAQQGQSPAGAAPQAQSAQGQGAQMNMQDKAQSAQGMSADVNGFTPIQTNQGTLLAGQFLQGLSGIPQDQKAGGAMGAQQYDLSQQPGGNYKQYGAPPMQQGIGMARGGIADIHNYKSGGSTDIYDASLRFADMLDNPNRYSPPDTRFHSVDTFRDTNPNTANKLADEAAETRRKAIEQRSYVNTGAKFPTVSRRPGQLDLGPVGGERGKYDNQESILAAQGGIMGYNLGGYASGGNPRLLRGPGDGMSDNIPATIADRQPARLADGEFVIPADVVSHLGNGSTEAGAKKLHEMMNSVRQARTGNSKQGKKINPNKFMPKK